MSPQQNNEAAPLTETDATSASPILTEEETAETGILCETPSGRLPVQRRDVASGESLDTGSMIRFVVSPDGILVPDVSHKLPGRGIWLRSERGGLEIALRRNIFSKAAKRQVKADPGLVDQVHGLLRRRCLDLLGLARREGLLISGYEKILGNVKAGKLAWLVEATDGSADGRNRILAANRAAQGKAKICGCFDNSDLSLALGLENAIHVALLPGRRMERWSSEMKRLSGFEPLVPVAWEGPGGPDG
ncbi:MULTISPECIES: RNA-binding protein [Asticcacaulis]|uniref:RNA-binding protein n=1 Tax=Asticcacaulis TaxID=76890 RepID=UPI001AEA421C|nr:MULTISPECIES: RNA-binding protein [Asticcacaulis]MBP2159870.1 putative RNA-binding protein YlxR (DUF448 family) [Asticcacaulis solisilvae]MDR6800915.1 putative RNA-binding protein YlxR (DUF448 family) [Asticcacaulis sp. BE141]